MYRFSQFVSLSKKIFGNTRPPPRLDGLRSFFTEHRICGRKVINRTDRWFWASKDIINTPFAGFCLWETES